MNKKILFSIFLSFAVCFVFSFSAVFATNTNPVEGIRNFVGGAENVIEDAANGVTSGIKNGTDAMTNGAENATGDLSNGDQNATDSITNGDYSATRTSASAEPTLAGINMTTWTWIILAVAAVGIITLIWSYLAQNKNNYDSYDD